jgi:hypothetical protein
VLLRRLEQGCRQPQRFEAVPEGTDIIMVAGPRKIAGVRARPGIADDRVDGVFLAKLRVPPVARREVRDDRLAGQPVIARSGFI